jgi:hypothetical protein
MRVKGIASKEQRVAETSRVLCEAMAGLAISPCGRRAQATMRNIRQNLFFAFIYNSIGVPIARGAIRTRPVTSPVGHVTAWGPKGFARLRTPPLDTHGVHAADAVGGDKPRPCDTIT